MPRGARARPEALRPARHPRADLEREEPARSRPTSTASASQSFYDQTVADVYDLYQRRLFASNAVDFDDLLMLTVEVLERFPEARERWQKAFRYVLVDEYQDTNHAQYRLLQLLAGEHENLCAVGDPDQSIYAFRGADIRNILEFERDFPGTRDDRARAELPLDEHDPPARRTRVIAHNRERKEKNLWSELGEGEPVRALEVEDEHAEARFVAAEIARARRGGLLGLARSRSSTGRTRSPACSRTCSSARASPYQVIGGPRFYERAEIKDADRVPPGDRQPGRRGLAAADREPAAARDRRRDARAAADVRRTRRAVALRGARVAPEEAGLGRRRRAAVHGAPDAAPVAPVGRAASCPSPSSSSACSSESGYLEALEAERTIEAAGRIENLQELVGVAQRVRRAGGRAEPLERSSRRSRSTPTRTRSRTASRSSR